MKKGFLFFLLIQFSVSAFCQWDPASLKLPQGGSDKFVELKPMTGVIYLKDSKINEWWVGTNKPGRPEYFGVVQFATDRLNINIYKSNGEHVTSFFLNDVKFKKEKRDPDSDRQVFTLLSKSKNITGKITINANRYLSGFSVTVEYNQKNSNGEDDATFLLSYDK